MGIVHNLDDKAVCVKCDAEVEVHLQFKGTSGDENLSDIRIEPHDCPESEGGQRRTLLENIVSRVHHLAHRPFGNRPKKSAHLDAILSIHQLLHRANEVLTPPIVAGMEPHVDTNTEFIAELHVVLSEYANEDDRKMTPGARAFKARIVKTLKRWGWVRAE